MANAMKFWTVQQGTTWKTVASETTPDLTVPPGERRKALHGYRTTKEDGDKRSKELATFYHGSYLP